MVYGYSRIPIVGWLRSQANESLLHAQEAGELITALGGHPSLGIGKLLACLSGSLPMTLTDAA